LHPVAKIRKGIVVELSKSPVFSLFWVRGWQNTRPAWRRPVVVSILVAGAVASLAACATERGDKRKLLERVPPPQPLLMASATFGENAIAVQAWLGPSVRLRKSDGESDVARKRPPDGERPGSRGEADSLRPDLADLGFNPFDQTMNVATPFGQSANRYSPEEIEEMYGSINYQYVRPPRLALAMTFTNTGSDTVTFAVTEVESLLGNYAPRPERFTLAPGQKGSLDPMLSNFENNYDTLDVTLGVRRGDKVETHLLRLQRVEPMPAPPANPARR
jgi:hypothetical protein